MLNQFEGAAMKYCPSCRNIMEYHGNGRYVCLLCCNHVVVLDKEPNTYYEVPFTNEEREAYYLARKEGIRNRTFFEREREREEKKKEAIRNEQLALNHTPVKKNPALQSILGLTVGHDEQENTNEEQGQSKQVENTANQQKKCIVCGKLIRSGSYCKECTFQQIRKLQRRDLASVKTDNYGNMRYKGYRDE